MFIWKIKSFMKNMIDDSLKQRFEKSKIDFEELKKQNPSFDREQVLKLASLNNESMSNFAKKTKEEYEKSQKFTNALLKEAESLHIPQLHTFEKENLNINDELSKHHDYLNSSSKLIEISKTISDEIYNYKINELNNRDIQPLPDNPNYAADLLYQSKIQNNSLERQIKQDQLVSEQQINKLQEQLDNNKESSIKQGIYNRRAIYITLGVAVISILVSLYSMNISVQKTDEIYQKENYSNTKQNTILNNKLDDIKQNTNNQQLIKNIENQTIILDKILKELKAKKENR